MATTLLVVAGLYGLAWLFATHFRRMADRDLEVEAASEPWEATPAPAG